MHVVYFACPGLPDAATQGKYRVALAPLGDVALVWLARPGLSRGFKGCRTIAGAVSQYGGAQGCGWPGATGREKLHRKLLAQAREAAK